MQISTLYVLGWLNHQPYLMRYVLVPFYRWRNESQRGSLTCPRSWQVGDGTRIQIQALWSQSCAFSPLRWYGQWFSSIEHFRLSVPWSPAPTWRSTVSPAPRKLLPSLRLFPPLPPPKSNHCPDFYQYILVLSALILYKRNHIAGMLLCLAFLAQRYFCEIDPYCCIKL